MSRSDGGDKKGDKKEGIKKSKNYKRTGQGFDERKSSGQKSAASALSFPVFSALFRRRFFPSCRRPEKISSRFRRRPFRPYPSRCPRRHGCSRDRCRKSRSPAFYTTSCPCHRACHRAWNNSCRCFCPRRGRGYNCRRRYSGRGYSRPDPGCTDGCPPGCNPGYNCRSRCSGYSRPDPGCTDDCRPGCNPGYNPDYSFRSRYSGYIRSDFRDRASCTRRRPGYTRRCNRGYNCRPRCSGRG